MSPSDPRPQCAAQGLTCGPWGITIPVGWGHRVVDEFEVVPLPGGAQWLAGIANIEGEIVPVVNLAAYLSSGDPVEQPPERQRLLVGAGAADSEEDRLGILFSGLPRQLRYRPESIGNDDPLTPRLRTLCTGIARDDGGRAFYQIDAAKLFDALVDAI